MSCLSSLACVPSLLSCVHSATLWTVSCQAPLSMGFSRQEYWSGLPPGDLPNSGIEPASLMSPALGGRFFSPSATWEALPSHTLVVIPTKTQYASHTHTHKYNTFQQGVSHSKTIPVQVDLSKWSPLVEILSSLSD